LIILHNGNIANQGRNVFHGNRGLPGDFHINGIDNPLKKSLSRKFKVENYLFKVPRYQFKNSEIFESTFLLPTGDSEPEGSSEAAPFKLEGVSASDFRNFLAALYPL